MSLTITHAKTNNVPDWTQADLDTVIAGGAPPAPAPGTLLADITLPSDWNDDHQFSGILDVANGGTGTASPSLVAGTNVTITGTWPNQTISASGGSGSGDVVGPASATDNAIVRFDGTTGKLIQNSNATIADTSGDITAGTYNGNTIGAGSTSGTNTGDQNIFSTIAVSGQSNVVADSTSDTLTLVAGSNITITTNSTTDEITIAASGGGGGAPTSAQYITLATDATLSNERVLTAGNLVDITDGGAGGNVTLDVDLSEASAGTFAIDDTIPFPDVSASNANAKDTVLDLFEAFFRVSHRYMFVFKTDFMQECSTTNVDGAMIEFNTGTGAGSNQSVNNNQDRTGILTATTGTTATGRATVMSDSTIIRMGGGSWFYEAEINVTTLSTSSERFQFVAGFMDTNNAPNQADGVFFLYDEGGVTTGSAASANWQIVTTSNSTRTFTTTSTAVSAATWVRLTIEVNADGTSAEFFINGSSVGTHTTNIPTGNNRTTGFGQLLIKSVGTTARTVDYDCVTVIGKYTTPRS